MSSIILEILIGNLKLKFLAYFSVECSVKTYKKHGCDVPRINREILFFLFEYGVF